MTDRVIGIDFGTSTSVILVRRYENGEPIDLVKPVLSIPTLVQKLPGGKDAYFGNGALVKHGKSAMIYKNFKLGLENIDDETRKQSQELTADFFKHMGGIYRHQDEIPDYLGKRTDNVKTYVSFPVKWSENTRQFMIDAAIQAGFPNVNGIDEAQACIQAITEQYAKELSDNGYYEIGVSNTILLIDMGAGTTDIVICRHNPSTKNSLEILTTWPQSGDQLFGGAQVDDLLYQYILDSFPNSKDRIDRLRIMNGDEFKKWKDLVVSPHLNKNETIDYFAALENTLGEAEFEPINRELFEKKAGEYLLGFPKLVNESLISAGITGNDIDLVVLTGGHSQWYFVREMLLGNMTQFGEINLEKIRKDPKRIISLANPQETVALGLVSKPQEISTLRRSTKESTQESPKEEKVIHIEAVEPDCSHIGNIEFWVRQRDRACFMDEKCTKPISYENTRVRNLGHNFEWKIEKDKKILACTRCGYIDAIEMNSVQGADLHKNEMLADEFDNSPTPEAEFQLQNLGNDYVIAKYIGNRSRVIIPDKIRGRKVVAIEKKAFAEGLGFLARHTLEYVEIPETIVRIGDWAFLGCRHLKTVKMHKKIEIIGSRAFGSTSLEIIDFGIKPPLPKIVFFPPDLKEIGSDAFSDDSRGYYQTYLREVTLSKKTNVRNYILSKKTFSDCAVFYYEDQK